MSGERKPLISNQENPNSSDYDVILIFKNFAIDDTEDELTPAKVTKRFRRVFRLDELSEKSLTIKTLEDSVSDFISSKNGEPIRVKDFYPFLIESIRIVLSYYLMLVTESKYSVDQDEIHVSCMATEENLMVQADLDEYLLQFKKDPSESLDFQEIPPFASFEKHDSSKASSEKAYRDYFKTYDRDDNEADKGTLFNSRDRLRLIYSMLCSCLDMGLVRNLGILLNFMPLSNEYQLNVLKSEWGNFRQLCRNPFKRGDFDRISMYFGEKIGMYFAWLEFLTYAMIPLGIIGLILGVVYVAKDNSNDTSDSLTSGELVCIMFALVLPFFSTFYEQFWIRKQATFSWRWGTTDLSQVEEQRPEYVGKYQQDPVTGKTKKVQKLTQNLRLRRTISISVVSLFIGLVLAAVIALFVYRSTLSADSIGPTLVGIANALQIKIFNFIYGYVAAYLNDWENFELPSEYSDSLTTKLFLFQFVNSYTSLFYIAFLKVSVEGCENDNCISELTLQLETIFITNLLLNFVEIFTPLLMTKYNTWKENKAIVEKYGQLITVSEEERQAKLSKYDTPLSDYMEVVIAYGYVILFGACFPFTSILFLLLIVIEVRVDAWKLCTLTQRPFPEASNSIGVWITILEIMSVIGAMTNIAIIIFTTNTFDIEETGDRWIMFMILEHILLFVKVSISLLVPDVPYKVTQGITWSKRVVDERLHGKLVDISKVRVARNLHFTSSKGHTAVPRIRDN